MLVLLLLATDMSSLRDFVVVVNACSAACYRHVIPTARRARRDTGNVIRCYNRYISFSDGESPSKAVYLANMYEKMQEEIFLNDTQDLLRPALVYNPQDAWEVVKMNLMFFFSHTVLAALIQNKIAKIFMPKLNFFIICVSKLRVYIIMNISRKIKI
jgi:hypothetical protein